VTLANAGQPPLRLTWIRPDTTLEGGWNNGQSLNEETIMKKSKSAANAKKQNGSKADGQRLIDLTPRKDAKGGTLVFTSTACGKPFPKVNL
jgi:hypothetical protein